jgi:hypothetical protein
MPDFSWVQQHAQIPVLGQVQAAFEQLGFQFNSRPATLSAQQRPRTIGATSDGRARVELIGPEEVVFKATILVRRPPPDDPAPLPPELFDFLTILIPTWTEGPAWLKTQLAAGATPVTTRHHELLIALRTARGGAEIVLGMTWQGSHGQANDTGAEEVEGRP